MATPSQEAVGQHVQSHVEYLLQKSPIYGHFFSSVKVIQAEPSRVVVHLPLEPHHLNSKNSLHGSVSATIVDFMGGVAIAASDLRDNTGVSTNISVDYCGGAKTGDVLEIEGLADKVGGSLAFTSITIRKVDEAKGPGRGALVALGRHTKYVKTR